MNTALRRGPSGPGHASTEKTRGSRAFFGIKEKGG